MGFAVNLWRPVALPEDCCHENKATTTVAQFAIFSINTSVSVVAFHRSRFAGAGGPTPAVPRTALENATRAINRIAWKRGREISSSGSTRKNSETEIFFTPSF